MSDSVQDVLKKAWLVARKGYLAPLEEAKAWALREVWRAEGKSEYGLNTFVASKVKKTGGGHPEREAVRKLFLKMDRP